MRASPRAPRHGWTAAGSTRCARCARGYGEARAMSSVGYRQVRDHLRGELPGDELLGAVVRATRVFARRQRTWLRDLPVEWLPPTG
ncbi:MAG: hypothetical protein WKG00_40450 [Polyangiaceae bacterium]